MKNACENCSHVFAPDEKTRIVCHMLLCLPCANAIERALVEAEAKHFTNLEEVSHETA